MDAMPRPAIPRDVRVRGQPGGPQAFAAGSLRTTLTNAVEAASFRSRQLGKKLLGEDEN